MGRFRKRNHFLCEDAPIIRSVLAYAINKSRALPVVFDRTTSFSRFWRHCDYANSTAAIATARARFDSASLQLRGRPVVAQPRPPPRPASPAPAARSLGSKIDEATIAPSGTFLHEAIRVLIQIVAR